MNGHLIVIEGLDSSGKATQSKLLAKRLITDGHRVMSVEFPNYKSPSSSLVKMYLEGQFGSHAEDVSPYAASSFYAVDRYASYKTQWQDFYLGGGIVVADRYTTSNMIHQACKIEDEKHRAQFLDWLCTYEYELLGLPSPDLTFFLDMPVDLALFLMQERKNKFSGSAEKDIHEKDAKHLSATYRTALSVSAAMGWQRVPCSCNGSVRSIEDIAEDIYMAVCRAFLCST